jgi:hypothetical protein
MISQWQYVRVVHGGKVIAFGRVIEIVPAGGWATYLVEIEGEGAIWFGPSQLQPVEAPVETPE